MTFEFYGWIIEYYVFSISPGHGDSGRGRPESRGDAFRKMEDSMLYRVCNEPGVAHLAAEPATESVARVSSLCSEVVPAELWCVKDPVETNPCSCGV